MARYFYVKLNIDTSKHPKRFKMTLQCWTEPDPLSKAFQPTVKSASPHSWQMIWSNQAFEE